MKKTVEKHESYWKKTARGFHSRKLRHHILFTPPKNLTLNKQMNEYKIQLSRKLPERQNFMFLAYMIGCYGFYLCQCLILVYRW